MSWLNGLKHAVKRFGEVETPRAERRPATGLGALCGLDSASTPAGVKNISTTGVYLLTEKRLSTGEQVTLILQEEGEREDNAELQFSVHARVARQGEDGIGLSFVLPPGLNVDLWGVLVRNIVVLTDPEQVADMFHTLRTILFLCGICQAGAEEPILLLGKELHPDRTASLLKIALEAERLLTAQPGAERMRAHPRLVANILREGSWATDELTLQFWTGLLVSSCSVDEPDESNQIFADLLVHFTPTEARIFNLACERALGLVPGHDVSASDSVMLSPKDVIEVTGVHDLSRAATDLAYLFNLGLIRNVFDFSSYLEIESFDVTPSSLGLKLYQHCHGSREKIDPQLVEVANAHLSNFLPPAQPIDIEDQAHPAVFTAPEG